MSAGFIDTHMHFYDGQYPVAAAATLFPPDATPPDYIQVQKALGLDRVVVVQPTTYGLDNSCQLAGMALFGDKARGVMVVDAATDRSQLQLLTERGVRGARFHMLPGGAVDWDQLEPVAAGIAEFGWHIQLQCNGRELGDRSEQLAALPTPLVIDHVGRFMPPVPIEDAAYQAMCQLLENGNTWIKLSAPYESSLEPITNDPTSGLNHRDVTPLIDDLVGRYRERLLWASNWPHPGQDPAPTTQTLLAQRDKWLPTAELRTQVLTTNPEMLYFSS